MLTRTRMAIVLLALAGPAIAHHGWGSYDARNPITVTGPIVTSKFENPHASITVRASDKVWTVIARADLPHDQPRRHRRRRGGRQHRVSLRLSLHGGAGRNARRTHHGQRQDLRDALMAEHAPAIFVAIQESGLAAAIRQSTWAYMAANVGHIVLLVLFAGAVAVMDLRHGWSLRRDAGRRRVAQDATGGDCRLHRPRRSPALPCSRPKPATSS